MAEEDKMQEKYRQFQMLQQQMEQISQHAELLNQQNAELDVSINAIKGIGKTKVNEEILVPIASGIFLKAELKNNQELIVNVGADVTIEKKVPEVIKLLEEQKGSMAMIRKHSF